MATRRHTAEQIIGKLREAEVELAKGQSVAKVFGWVDGAARRAGARHAISASILLAATMQQFWQHWSRKAPPS